MKEHKHAEVLRAIAAGKEVEYMGCFREWIAPLTANPITRPDLEWRIKPEPKPPIVTELHIAYESFTYINYGKPENIRFTFDPDTKLPIKVELIDPLTKLNKAAEDNGEAL